MTLQNLPLTLNVNVVPLFVRNSRVKPLFEAIGLPSTIPAFNAEGMPRIITFCTFS